MHLADAFIQSDLHCIQVTDLHLTSSCFPWESYHCELVAAGTQDDTVC